MAHSRPEQDCFSPGFQKLLFSLTPYKSDAVVCFPARCPDARISATECPRAWFRRMVEDGLDTDACAVEENMAVIARVRYRSDLVVRANIQVLVAEADLTTLFVESSTRCSYFRMDHEPDQLGPCFKEPLPHIHSAGAGAPRFPCAAPTANIIVDFFDFIYRNFHHELWLKWAQHAYRSSSAGTRTDDDPFPFIEEAFRAGKHEALIARCAQDLRDIKFACRSMKDKIFSKRVDAELSSLLSYDAPW